MAMVYKVKRMYFREKRSVREIVRLMSLSRNTVRRWLKAPAWLTHASLAQIVSGSDHLSHAAWLTLAATVILKKSRFGGAEKVRMQGEVNSDALSSSIQLS
jgi:hypothetical protein